MKQFILTHADNHVTHAAIGGGLTGVAINISSGDVLHTIILSTIGFLTSFILSLIVKQITKHLKK